MAGAHLLSLARLPLLHALGMHLLVSSLALLAGSPRRAPLCRPLTAPIINPSNHAILYIRCSSSTALLLCNSPQSCFSMCKQAASSYPTESSPAAQSPRAIEDCVQVAGRGKEEVLRRARVARLEAPFFHGRKARLQSSCLQHNHLQTKRYRPQGGRTTDFISKGVLCNPSMGSMECAYEGNMYQSSVRPCLACCYMTCKRTQGLPMAAV